MCKGEGDGDGVVVGEERTGGAKAEGDRRKRRHAAQTALGNKAATTEAEDRARGRGEDDSSTLHCTIYRLASFCPFAGVQRPDLRPQRDTRSKRPIAMQYRERDGAGERGRGGHSVAQHSFSFLFIAHRQPWANVRECSGGSAAAAEGGAERRLKERERERKKAVKESERERD